MHSIICYCSLRLAGLLMVLGLLLLPTACTPSQAGNTTTGQSLGWEIPDFQLMDLNGAAISAQELRGKYVVIHFATTWCPFCNAEAPYLEQLYTDYRDRGVEVLIIDVKEDPELVKEKLVDRFQLSFPVLLDSDGAVATSFAPPDVLPALSRDEVMLASNLLIDPDGKARFFSLLDTEHFDAQLTELKSVLDELL